MYAFPWKAGNPNIVILDRWREDSTPFNLVFAAQYFKEHYYPDAKLHIYGVPRNQNCMIFLVPFIKNGLIGEMAPLVVQTDQIYRNADLLITPNIICSVSIHNLSVMCTYALDFHINETPTASGPT